MKMMDPVVGFTFTILVFLMLVVQLHQSWPFTKSAQSSKIVTVDVTDLTQQFVAKLAQAHRTPTEQQQAIKQFAQNLQQALTTLSQQQHVVILPSQAVIAGAPDETATIAKAVGIHPGRGGHDN